MYQCIRLICENKLYVLYIYTCTAASILIDLFSFHSLDDAEYVKAMAEGGGNLEHLNIVLHGPPGSGKSSLKRAILGEDPLPQVEQNSTGIMENAVRAVSMDRMKSFTVIKDKDLLELLAGSMKHCAQQKSSQDQMSANVSDTSVVSLPKRIARFFQSIFHVREISGSTDTSLPSTIVRFVQVQMASHHRFRWSTTLPGLISFPLQQQLFLPTPGDAINR